MPPQKQAAHHKYTIFINEDYAPMTYSMTSSAGTNPKSPWLPRTGCLEMGTALCKVRTT